MEPGWNHFQISLVEVEQAPENRKMNLKDVFRLGLFATNLKEPRVLFFDYFHKLWLPAAQAQIGSGKARLVQNFKKAFRQQEAKLVSYVKDLWGFLEDGHFGIDQILEEWHLAHQKLGNKLQQAIKGNLIGPRRTSEQEVALLPSGKPKEVRYLWPILADFVHLTNNRLGVYNRDESYLAYIIMNSL